LILFADLNRLQIIWLGSGILDWNCGTKKSSENPPNPCQETENKKLRQIEIYL
jgi:hypothetical protein